MDSTTWLGICTSGVGIAMGRRMVNPVLLIQQAPYLGNFHVLRGGNWGGFAYLARCAYRLNDRPNYAMDYIGFRCVKGL